MKHIISLVALTLLCLLSSPQDASAQARFGFHGGLNFANLVVEDNGDLQPEVRTLWLAGVNAEAPITNHLLFTTSPRYVVKGADAVYKDLPAGNVGYVELDYIEIPLGLKLRMMDAPATPFAYLGGSVAFNLDANEHYEALGLTYDRNLRGEINDVDILVQAGLGFEYFLPTGVGFTGEVRYSRSVVPVAEDGDDVYTSDIMLTVGVLFQ